MNLEALLALVRQNIHGIERSENPNDTYGGNYDDAYEGGIRYGRQELAQELEEKIVAMIEAQKAPKQEGFELAKQAAQEAVQTELNTYASESQAAREAVGYFAGRVLDRIESDLQLP